MTEELIKEDGITTIELGGKSYELSPINLNVLTYIEEEFNCSIEGLNKIFNAKGTKKAKALRDLVHIFLRDNYPDLTKTEIGKLITLKNLTEVSETLGNILKG